MRKLIPLMTFTLLGIQLFAQQDPQFSLNRFNHLMINPAFAGMNDAICVSTIYRNQWMGFEGAPKSLVFSGHMPLENISSGVGLNIVSDNLGFEKNMLINGAYSYHLKLDGGSKIGLGVGLGMANKAIDGEWVTPDGLEGIQQNPYADIAIPHSESHIVFDFNFGAFFRTKDGIYVGLSTTHITQPELKFEDGKMPFVRRHYYVAANYPLPMKSISTTIEGDVSLFMKFDGATAQYDINAIFTYSKKFWFGGSFRPGDCAVAMLGYTLPQNIGIGMAYDVTTSKLRSYSSGSIEFMIKYCFNIKAAGPRGTNRSVRYL